MGTLLAFLLALWLHRTGIDLSITYQSLEQFRVLPVNSIPY